MASPNCGGRAGRRSPRVSAAGQAPGPELPEDETKFIDLPNSPLWLTYEYPQVNPIPGGTRRTGTQLVGEAVLLPAPAIEFDAEASAALLAH